MTVLVVTGTGTGVGKTVVTAAVAALARAAGSSVAVVKPAQTGARPGEPGDVDDVRRLTGLPDVVELARYPDPVAPATAARLSGLPAVDLRAAAQTVAALAQTRDLVIVEGAGGLLVRFDSAGATLADLAGWLRAPVLVVTRADLGTLNHTALTIEALTTRGLTLAGVVIGEWPAEPDLACRTNLPDLSDLTGAPVSGALAAGAGTLSPDAFLDVARAGLSPALGGTFDPDTFAREHRPPHPEDHL
jgi:dethiobiotin synthetase